MTTRLVASVLLLTALVAAGCKNDGVDASDPRVAKGKAVFQANCTACHNMDPTKPGALGPEIAGSAQELIEARVMRAEYPAGYTPKRTTRTMVALPQLQGEIESLYYYLNSIK